MSEGSDYLLKFQSEHAIETYKGLIQISLAAFQALLLINGGALVALLGYLANAKAAPVPTLASAAGFFVIGLAAATFAVLIAYLTQLRLFIESREGLYGNRTTERHTWPLWLAVLLVFVSASSFGWGAWSAVAALATGKPN